jgi:hypothetical protein
MFQNVEVAFGQQIIDRIQVGGLPISKATRPMLKMLNAKDNHQGAKQMKMESNEVGCLQKQ